MSQISTLENVVDWVVGRALPLWATRGFDAERGRFHERLDATGAPMEVPYRSMVQARQIFVFAETCRAGWFAEGGDLALRAMQALQQTYGVADRDRLAFRFATYGPAADDYDSYGHAFVLLAIAAVHKLSPSAAFVDMADRVTRFVDQALFDPDHGGLFDTVACASAGKRQNPVMHLFEAYIALEESMPGHAYLDRASTLFRLFEQRLYDSASGTVREHFRRDWGRHDDGKLADLVEPGHLFEWIWLLDRYGRLARHDLRGMLDALDQAAAAGVTETGLIADTLQSPNSSVAAPSHRLWPHTEAIKAAGVRHRRGDAAAAARADLYSAALGRHFLDAPFAGGWIDRIDANGAPLLDEVPASSLYHLALATLDAASIFDVRTVASHDVIR